jgi:hypothetical protein
MLPIIVSWVVFLPVTAEANRSPSSTKSNSLPPIAQSVNSSQPNPIDKAWVLIRTARRQAANQQSAQANAALVEAEQTAALLSNSETSDRLLAIIAAEQAKLGNDDRAIAIASRISNTTMPLQGCCIPVRTEAEIAIVQAYLNAGQINLAQQFAENIQPASSRNPVLVPVVAYLADQGQFTDAIALSQHLAEPADRARYAIIKGYINADRFTDALQFTQTVTDESERSSLLTLLAQWAWRSGKNDLSYQILNQIPQPGQTQAWVEVALAYASAGQQEQALNILSQAYQLAKTQPNQSFAQWAGYFAQIGAFDRAIAITNSLTGYEKADATVTIARAYSDSGQYARAISLVQQVQDGELQPFGDMPDLKVEALYQIVRQAAKDRQYDLAMRAVDSLKQGQHRVEALRTIAQQYRIANQPQQAAAMLDQAIAAARTVDKLTLFYDRNTYFTVSNAGLLIKIAQDYGMLNRPERVTAVLDEALQSARTLKEANESSVREQVQYLSTIAKRYVQLGQRDRALAAAEGAVELVNQFPGSDRSSSFPTGTVQPIAEAAQIFYIAGEDQQAMEMLSGLRTVSSTFTDKQQQLWAIVAIVKAYAAMDAEAQVKETVEAALTLAQSLESAQQGWLIDRLAVAAASSDPAYAIQLVYNKLDRARQIPTLAQIAVNYYAAGQAPQAQAVVIGIQQIAEVIPDDGQREQGLNDAIRSYFVPQGVRNLSISQLLQAGQINADIQSPNLKAYNWSLIAQAYAFQGEAGRASETIQFALDAAKTIPDRFERRDLLWQMFEEALRVGESSLAAQIATGFEEESYRTVALQRMKFVL